MGKRSRKNKEHNSVNHSVLSPQASLSNPFLTSSNDRERRKSKSTIFNTAKTGRNVDPRLISDLRKIASSPISKAAAFEAKESPSYKASQRVKMKHRLSSQSISSSPPMFQSNLADYDDLDDIMDFEGGSQDRMKQNRTASNLSLKDQFKSTTNAIKTEDDSGSETDTDASSSSSSSASSSSSSEKSESETLTQSLAIQAPATSSSSKIDSTTHCSTHEPQSLKRKYSIASASSSSDENSSSSDSDDENNTTKRIKLNSPTEAKSSTVASRNPLPPEFLNGTFKPRPTSHALELKPEFASEEMKHILPPAHHTYPREVLAASHSLESILPAYLTSTDMTEQSQRLDRQLLRPAAGSDDTTRLVTVLNSAKKLILHLSAKKLIEGEADLQGQLLRVANDREQMVKVMEREVKRLLAVKGNARR